MVVVVTCEVPRGEDFILSVALLPQQLPQSFGHQTFVTGTDTTSGYSITGPDHPGPGDPTGNQNPTQTTTARDGRRARTCIYD